MAALQTGAGDRELMNQEDTPSVIPLFMTRDLEVLRDRRADVEFKTSVHKVFVGVDPGTHSFSQTAIVSIVPTGENGRLEQVVRSLYYIYHTWCAPADGGNADSRPGGEP